MYNLFYELVPVPSLQGVYCRRDTRLYHEAKLTRKKTEGICIGAVWMCNPSTSIREASLNDPRWLPAMLDRTLEEVSAIFTSAVGMKYPAGIEPKDIYLQILNLFYIVDKNPQDAYDLWCLTDPKPATESIHQDASFVWLAWGYEDLADEQIATAFFPLVQGELNLKRLPYFYLDSKGILYDQKKGCCRKRFFPTLHPKRFYWARKALSKGINSAKMCMKGYL